MIVVFVENMDPKKSSQGGRYSYMTNLIFKLLQKNMDIILVGVSYRGENSIKSKFKFIPVAKGKYISGYNFLTKLCLKSLFLKLPKHSIIHTQRPDQLLPFTLFYKNNPKVCTLHGIDYEGVYFKKGKIVGTIYALIEKFTLKRVHKIIAVNEGTRDYYIKKYPWLKDKITVIPVGVDTNKFKPMNKEEIRKKYGFNETDKVILYVGRLEKEKVLDLLIKSFKDLKDQLRDAKLVLVGDGREREKLENLVRKLKLKDVIFMSTLEHDKVPEILNCADVFVLTSLYESGPLVVQEALSCGVPVVSVDVGRVREFISDDLTGKIVSRDKESISSAIINFLVRTDQADIKKSCRERALGFDFKNTAKKTIEVYEGVLS